MNNETVPLLFSIVIPTFNRPGQLGVCLATLQQLERRDWDFEIIVVDDGSPVDLQPVVDQAQGPHPIHLFRQANSGPGAARNRGAKEACGQFLAFTDDDCRPDPTWLIELAKAFEADPTLLLGGKTINLLDQNPYAASSQLISDLVYAHYNPDPDRARFFASNNMAFPKTAFLETGGFAPQFRVGAEDREICDRWFAKGHRLRFISTAVVQHAHDLTFRGFLRQHFHYGRGAYQYHQLRRHRGTGKMTDDMPFHYHLPRTVRVALSGMPLMTQLTQYFLLGAWQMANAFGFFFAMLRLLPVSKSSDS